ncbi:MAG TPA: Fic family protein [Patescibacteria group bacterium]|nr:Fic family protein [Patescibacteria group bacterium]
MYIPKFVITNKILKNIGAIEAAKEVIENAPLVPMYEKRFKSDAMLRTVHHGTHIEGNDLNIDQTKQVLEGIEIFAKERDIQEVINYRNVVGLLDELSVKRGGYDINMLTEIHRETVRRVVPEEKVGVIRKTQVVLKEEGSGEVVFRPPSYEKVPYLLEDFIDWLNDPQSQEIHPIIKAGIAHYILVSIHPFVEGNGRTIRAFSTLILLRESYDIKKFFALEEHFDENPGDYYEAFSNTDSKEGDIFEKDVTSWLEYFTGVVAIELSKIKEKIRKLSIDTRLKGVIGMQVALTERQMKLIEYMGEKGYAAMQNLKDVLPMVSEDTVLRDLNYLIEKKIIKKEGRTKAARYVMASNK